MSLLSILLVICALGVILWLVNSYLPMDGKVKNILNIVVILVLIVWLLRVFGIWSYLAKIHF